MSVSNPVRNAALALTLTLAGSFAPAVAAWAQEPAGTPASLRGKRLVLTDGSFQLVRSWERKGDRIRFYSIERASWEEIPATLVDFAATQQAEADAARAIEATQEKLKSIEQTRLVQEVDVDASIEIAPGMFLPDDDGLFALQCDPEDPANPRPATARCIVLTLSQISTEAKVDKKQLLKKIFTPIPIVAGKHRIYAAGKAADVRIFSAAPEFYIRTVDGREPELELIRAVVKGDKREVNVVSTNVVGQKSNDYKPVAMNRWQVAKGVYRITVGESLAPGEYALAEFVPGERTGIGIFVWDFGVDSDSAPRPTAPAKKK